MKSLCSTPPRRSGQADRLAALKEKTAVFGGPLEAQHRAVIATLQRAVPADALVVSDMTQVAYSGNCAFHAEHPGTWIHPFGYGTLGFALPAAIGAQLGAPDRAVVSVSGDGGFLYTPQEMATAAELQLPIVQVLWNNDALAMIRDGMAERGIELVGVLPENPDYLALARAFHWKADRANSLAELEALVKAGLAGPGPSLIEVREGEGDWAEAS